MHIVNTRKKPMQHRVSHPIVNLQNSSQVNNVHITTPRLAIISRTDIIYVQWHIILTILSPFLQVFSRFSCFQIYHLALALVRENHRLTGSSQMPQPHHGPPPKKSSTTARRLNQPVVTSCISTILLTGMLMNSQINMYLHPNTFMESRCAR